MKYIQTDSQMHVELALNKPKALSLFTGAGGLDIGFHRMGFDIVACVEIEPIFCKTLASITAALSVTSNPKLSYLKM